MTSTSLRIPIKIGGHWQMARVHTLRADLFVDIPAELIRLVEDDHPGRGSKFGYQVLIERFRIAELFRADLHLRDELSRERSEPEWQAIAMARSEECETLRSQVADMAHRLALTDKGLEDAINTLAHLMKQRGKPDQGEIVSCVVQNVVGRLHAVRAYEDPYADNWDEESR